MTEFEDYVTEHNHDPIGDVFQFILDGMAEENGELFSILKRMRRGDFGDDIAELVVKKGLRQTLLDDDFLMDKVVKEIGDRHWYETRFIQLLGKNWNDIESANMEKLRKREKNRCVRGSGDTRGEDNP